MKFVKTVELKHRKKHGVIEEDYIVIEEDYIEYGRFMLCLGKNGFHLRDSESENILIDASTLLTFNHFCVASSLKRGKYDGIGGGKYFKVDKK